MCGGISFQFNVNRPKLTAEIGNVFRDEKCGFIFKKSCGEISKTWAFCLHAFITYPFKHAALCVIALLRWEKLNFSSNLNMLLIAFCSPHYPSPPPLCISFHRIYCSLFLSEWIQKHERDESSGGGRLVDCALLVPLWLFCNSPFSLLPILSSTLKKSLQPDLHQEALNHRRPLLSQPLKPATKSMSEQTCTQKEGRVLCAR